jgi:hypothetical protein
MRIALPWPYLHEESPVDIDKDILIALLAVRLQGGQAAPADAAALKALKKQIEQARRDGLLAQSEIRLPAVSKSGKASTKKAKVIGLTPEGEQLLQRAADADALRAATAVGLTALQHTLESDRQALRAEVAALAGKGKAAAAPGKEIGELAKKVADMAARLQRLEAALDRGADPALPDRIDQHFDALRARLEETLRGLPAVPVAVPPPPPIAPPSLRAALRDAYERLCGFREFEDGIVPLPRLYHEAARLRPGLTSAEFRREIETLWNSRVLQCHVLNEVREAADTETAFWKDDKLYYFIYWPGP